MKVQKGPNPTQIANQIDNAQNTQGTPSQVQANVATQGTPAVTQNQFEQASPAQLSTQVPAQQSIIQSGSTNASQGSTILSLQLNPDIGPGPGISLQRTEDAANALQEAVNKIQSRMTEELRTEDGIQNISVKDGQDGPSVIVVARPDSPYTPAQLGAASRSLLDELGYKDVDVDVIAPAVNPFPPTTEARAQGAASALREAVNEIQSRMTEELRTEDAIQSVVVKEGDRGFELGVVMGPHSAFTPPQVDAAARNLLKELGFQDVNVDVIAPAVQPLPGPIGGRPMIPDTLRTSVEAAIDAAGGFDQLPKLDQAPEVEDLETYLLRDMMPVDGPRDEVYIDRTNNSFYLSSTIMSMAGPQYSGTSWFGPVPLEN